MDRIPTPLFNELSRIENELAMEALDAAREAQLSTTGPMASAAAKARAEVADRVARRLRDLLLPGAIVTPLHGLPQDWQIPPATCTAGHDLPPFDTECGLCPEVA